MSRRNPRVVAAFMALVTVALLLIFTTAAAAAASQELRAAPLNPGFVQYQKDLAAGRLATSAGGHGRGLRPAPFDVSYLDRLAVPGTVTAYPAKYDLRTLGRVTPAKDQGPNGTCWVFATMSSLESCLLLPPATTAYDFAEDNCVLKNGFYVLPEGPYATGGFYQESTAYLARWGGPILESQDPYGDGVTPTGLALSKHVQQVLWLPGRGYLPGENVNWTGIAKDAAKGAVTARGGVWSTIHVGGNEDQTAYFNDATDAWYYNGTGNTDHAVLIAGWDDNYPASNFAAAHRPPGNGAWIVKNSWGTGWGANGFFYVSYYDTKFGDCLACFDNAEATSNYKGIYQYDPLGVCNTVGWNTSTSWFASTFTAGASDGLAAVGFYAMAPGTTYQVYAGATLAGKALKASGTVTYAGYYTVKLPTPMQLTNGQKFSVAVKVTTPGTGYPIPIELPITKYSDAATAAAGQSYISQDGAAWTDLTTLSGFAKANVCLKAFTKAALTTTRYQESNAFLTYSPAWTAVTNASCSGGYMRTRNAAGSVTATFSGTAVKVIATKGPAYGKLKVTLDNIVQPTVDLYAATTAYQQPVYSKSGLASAAHTLKLEWTGTRNTLATGTTVDLDALDVTGALTQAPLPALHYQENDARLAYGPAWTVVTNASCDGGTMRARSSAGSVTATFSGTGVGVLATKGPAYGKLKVTLDGVVQPTVDLYAAALTYKQKVYAKAGLANAAHTLRLDWTNTKNALATATTVNLDALDVNGTLTQALPTVRTEETSTKLTYSPAWTAVTNAACSGGAMRTRNAAGSLTATFTGISVGALATKGPAYGKLKVTFDGVVQPTVDLYAAALTYKQTVFSKTGLANAAHTLKLEWTGTKNAGAAGTTVNLDALDVRGTLTQAPLATLRYQESDAKLVYSPAWTAAANAACSGGAMRTRNAAGSLTAAFSGTGIGVVATKGAAYGKLKVTVDGVVQPTVDLYSAATAYQQNVYAKAGLANAAHTLKLEWTGTKNAAATGTTVNLDALDVQGVLTALPAVRYQESDARLAYSPAWTALTNAACSGGSMRTRNAAGLVTATFTGTGIGVVATKGAAYGKLKVTVDGVVQPTVDLYAAATAYQQKVYAKAGLAYAAHTLRLEWTGTKNALATGTTVNLDALDVTGTLAQGPAIYQESDAKLVYSPAWTAVSNAACSVGTMRTRNAAGSVTAAFTGTSVGVIATKGLAYGKLKVTLDNVVQPAVDLYAAATAYQQKVYAKSGLTNAAHILKLEWTGTKNAAATGTTVDLDALEIMGTLTTVPSPTARYQETDTRLRYLGTWSSESSSNYSGGAQKKINATGAAVINFTGTQVGVIATKGPAYGKLTVTLDDVAQPIVDLYAAANAYQQKVYAKTGLANVPHTLVVDWAGAKNAAATGTTVNLDAFEILGSLTQVPDLTGGLVGYWAMTPEGNWFEYWKFWADGTYNYFVTDGYTWYNEEGLYAAYQGANSKMVLLFDRRHQDGPEWPWEYDLTTIECPYWITYYSDGTLLNVHGPNLDVNYWLQP